jgi:hypothetical protein
MSAQERILLLTKGKKRMSNKVTLKIDEKLDLYVSAIASALAFTMFLSIPFVSLESPCEIFKDLGYNIYQAIKFVDKNFYIVDSVLISLMILLIYVTLTMILDAMKRTKINLSPWVQRGKYKPPKKKFIPKKMDHDDFMARIGYEQCQSLILNGRYYEQCGGMLKEKKLEEYRHRVVNIPRDHRRVMTYQELAMFEKQYDMYRNRVLKQKELEERKKF